MNNWSVSISFLPKHRLLVGLNFVQEIQIIDQKETDITRFEVGVMLFTICFEKY